MCHTPRPRCERAQWTFWRNLSIDNACWIEFTKRSGVTPITAKYAPSTSASEREAKMRANGGWEPAGDAVGGARNTSYQNLGKSFSYANQASKADNPLRERNTWRPQ